MGAVAFEEVPSAGAVEIVGAGGPDMLVVRDRPVPAPGPGAILVAVEAAGVNRHDVNQRRRGPSTAHSDVPGLEVAGRVVAIGPEVTEVAVGDAIAALTDGGGYAEYAVAAAACAFAIPEGMGFVEAAALPEALFTVWHNFFGIAALGPGETVLIHGGTSGVGMRRDAGKIYGGRMADPATAAAHAAAIIPPSMRGYFYQMLAICGWSSLPWLWRIKAPTLVMYGRRDPIIPAINARAMALLLPRSRLVEIDDGHLFMLTSAEETAEHLRAFLGEPHPSIGALSAATM